MGCVANICVGSARFMPANMLFKYGDITKERTVERYELVLFLKDGGYASINGKKHPIRAGSVRFHRPGDRVYSCRYNDIYVVHFTVDDFEKSKDFFDKVPSFLTLHEFEEEIVIFKKLITALLEQDDFECVSCLLELLKRIKDESRIGQKNTKEQMMSQIKRYIEDNFSKPLTLTQIAQNFYMHPIYMQRKFKREVGMTPAEYQKSVRLSKAKAYLLTTDLAIDEISELCGFCNTSYFIKIFKTELSATPLQFRNKSELFDVL